MAARKETEFHRRPGQKICTLQNFHDEWPHQTLYKLYISKDLDLEKIDQLNFRFGMDGSQPAPENPEIIQRNWVRKKNADGTVKK